MQERRHDDRSPLKVSLAMAACLIALLVGLWVFT